MSNSQDIKLAQQSNEQGCEHCNHSLYCGTKCKNCGKQSNEQVEPVAWRWPYKFKDIGQTGAYEYHSHEFACLAHLPKGEPLYTHPPAPYVTESRTAQPKKPEQEPVAWITQGGKGWLRWHKSYDDNKDSVPLYTTPPQRKPLTYVELRRIANQCGLGASEVSAQAQAKVDNFARAIEAAHGIKE